MVTQTSDDMPPVPHPASSLEEAQTMAKIQVHNPLPDPLIYTSTGQFLGGNETATGVDGRDKLVRHHLETGRLIVPATPSPEEDPA